MDDFRTSASFSTLYDDYRKWKAEISKASPRFTLFEKYRFFGDYRVEMLFDPTVGGVYSGRWKVLKGRMPGNDGVLRGGVVGLTVRIDDGAPVVVKVAPRLFIKNDPAARDELRRVKVEGFLLLERFAGWQCVVPAIELAKCHRAVYLVMHHVPGGSLASKVNCFPPSECWHQSRYGLGMCPIPTRRVRGAMLKVADAVRAVHGVGFAHRDIKPGNILVRGSGCNEQFLLCDFGSAYRIGSAMNPTLMGTPAFMAPELMASDDAYDPFAADIFSLGVTFYCMVFGRHPFTFYDHAVIPVSYRPEFPEIVLLGQDDDLYFATALIEQMMAPEPKERPHIDLVVRALREDTRLENLPPTPCLIVTPSLRSSTVDSNQSSSARSSFGDDNDVISPRKMKKVITSSSRTPPPQAPDSPGTQARSARVLSTPRDVSIGQTQAKRSTPATIMRHVSGFIKRKTTPGRIVVE